MYELLPTSEIKYYYYLIRRGKAIYLRGKSVCLLEAGIPENGIPGRAGRWLRPPLRSPLSALSTPPSNS